MPRTHYTVVDKESNTTYDYLNFFEARSKLVELVTLGIATYMFSQRLYA